MSAILTAAVLVVGSVLGITGDVREVRTAGIELSQISATCPGGQKVNSYRLIGQPGSTVEWGSKSYEIPSNGSIELMASKRVDTYGTPTGSYPLPNEGPTDPFGVLTIDVTTHQVLDVQEVPRQQLVAMALGANRY